LRLPSSNPDIIAAFDPFQTDLQDLQKQYQQLQLMNTFQRTSIWPANLPKSEANSLQNLASKLYKDSNKIM
jgi:hypothetical protein